MLRSFAIAAAAAFLLSAGASTAAPGYTLDAKGNCHAADGKMAKKSMCAAPATAATATGGPSAAMAKGAGGYSLDAKGNCHAPDGKMAKKSMCAAPATTASATGGPVGAMASAGGPNCKKGKRCGNACISVNDTCHK